MSMGDKERTFNGHDVSTDEFADALRAIADDIDDGAVQIMETETTTQAKADEPTEFGLAFQFYCEMGSRTLPYAENIIRTPDTIQE